jgi:hypothetical protein
MAAKKNFQFNADGTVTFKIAQVGDRSRTTYEGPFRVKSALSPFDELSAGRDMRALLGEHGVQALDHEANIAYALAQLRYRIVECPLFWTEKSREGYGGAELDSNIILNVLTMAVEAEVADRKRLKEEAKQRLQEMSAALEADDAAEAAPDDSAE